MKISEHLKAHHVACATFHKNMATAHRDAVVDCEDGSAAQLFHKAASHAHAEHAAHHLECCEKLVDVRGDEDMPNVDHIRAAMGADDLEKIVPDGVRRVIPSGILLVPRTGAPDPNVMKDLDPEVAKVLGELA